MPSALRTVTQLMKSTVWNRAASGVESMRCVVAAVSMSLPPVSSMVTQTQRNSDVANAPCLGEAARAGKLDGDAVDEIARMRLENVLEACDALVEDEWVPAHRPDSRDLGQRHAWLLDIEIGIAHCSQESERGVDAPSTIGVGHQQHMRRDDGAHGAHALDILERVLADLHLDACVT